MNKRREALAETGKQLARLYFSSTGSITKTAKLLGVSPRDVRPIVVESNQFIPSKELRNVVLNKYYDGKTNKEISLETGLCVDSVQNIIRKYRSLNSLSDITIIPHRPFPKVDDFELRPPERERLEALRTAKVEKYYELQVRKRRAKNN